NQRARARVMAGLENQPRYQAAVRQRAETSQTVTKQRNSGAGGDELSRAASAAMAARAAVTKMETEALAADTAATAAKAKLADAARAMAQLRQQERGAIASDADWQAAQQQYTASRGGGGAGLTSAEQLR